MLKLFTKIFFLTMKLYKYSNPNQLAKGLCKKVEDQLSTSIKKNNRAVLVLSGGHTPNLYLPKLFSSQLIWEKIHITFSDERWVPPQHVDSNEGLIKKHLPKIISKKVNITSLWENQKNPSLVIDNINKRLSLLPSPYDVAILGMGEDGHFASLFPNMGETRNSSSHCLCTFDIDKKPRISLSPKSLLSIKHIHLCVIGKEKMNTFKRAMMTGNIDSMPIRLLLKNKVNKRLTVHYST